MRRLLVLCFSLSLFCLPALAQDLLIRNARIVDGTGTPWYRGDVLVRGDSIAAIGRGLRAPGARVIDAGGRVVAPGFIDPHNHARRAIFEVPSAENFIRQGVTTLLEGPDGSSPIPLADFLARIEKVKTSVNIGLFVGQGSVREKVVGLNDRKATAEEIEKMKEIVRQEMQAGAFGLSTGLFYVPGAFTPTEEVIELAKVAGALGGIHISHMRDEAAGVLDSVKETIRIGEEGGLPTQITHHKIVGKGNWGRSTETLRLVAAARARGVDVTIDQYPYTASSTGLQQLLPSWALEGGRAAMRKRIEDPETRQKIHAGIVKNILENRGGGDARNVQITYYALDPSLTGKNLAQITIARGKEPTPANAADTTLDMVLKGEAGAIFHAIQEDDVKRIMRDPNTMIGSDGQVLEFGRDAPHPRAYGTFARVLGRYVREQGILTLEEAIRKMSGYPAARIGLTDRGVLRPGMKADIVIFDPNTVIDKATYESPHQYAEGFTHAIVNGQVVLEDGKVTAARPGRALRGPAWTGR